MEDSERGKTAESEVWKTKHRRAEIDEGVQAGPIYGLEHPDRLHLRY
jgi:hypothetical protein